MVTTELLTALATAVNRDSSGWVLSSVVKVTFDVVNASTTSAVLRPMMPPTRPISSATAARMASAGRDTRPPKRTSRTPSFGAGAPDDDTGALLTAGLPSWTCAVGSRHGSSAASGPSSAASSLPASAGWRWSDVVALSGRPKACASTGSGGPTRGVYSPWSRYLSAPWNEPDTPDGRPKARCEAGSTGGRSTGRGANRGAVS
ncbi:Uncharacterised protein [Mycobacteroides abscessus subsp. abscessus]|nr:Uncharacterised protein [Mycobacteroides abscessus subsp. abscessus]